MTIVKHETVELTSEEVAIIGKCIKMLNTIKKGAEDPVLTHEAHTLAVNLDHFKRNFTVRATPEQEQAEKEFEEWRKQAAGADVDVQVRGDETMSDYDRGFQDGAENNPSVRPNY